MAAAACGGSTLDNSAPNTVLPSTGPPRTALPSDAPPGTEPPSDRAIIDPGAIVDLGSAVYEPAEHEQSAEPLRLTIASIGVASAPVVAVGVTSSGDLEVPDARSVGWYRFGSGPDEPGSTVLAAHVAYNGRNGVFRHLADVEAGDMIDVVDAGAVTWRYRATSVEQFAKSALPVDRVWRRDGPSQLVLITCGGSFDSRRRHYDDNVVVFASPMSDAAVGR